MPDRIDRFQWLSKGKGIFGYERPRVLPTLSDVMTPKEAPCGVCGGVHSFIKDKVCAAVPTAEGKEACAQDFEAVFTKGMRENTSSEERRSKFQQLFRKWGIRKMPPPPEANPPAPKP